MERDSIIEKNMSLCAQFLNASSADPTLLEGIPDEAYVVLFNNEPDLTLSNFEYLMRFIAIGEPVIQVHATGDVNSPYIFIPKRIYNN